MLFVSYYCVCLFIFTYCLWISYIIDVSLVRIVSQRWNHVTPVTTGYRFSSLVLIPLSIQSQRNIGKILFANKIPSNSYTTTERNHIEQQIQYELVRSSKIFNPYSPNQRPRIKVFARYEKGKKRILTGVSINWVWQKMSLNTSKMNILKDPLAISWSWTLSNYQSSGTMSPRESKN